MALPVFQSLLVDHIWMMLLLQRIFSEVLVLILYSIMDQLYGYFSYFRGFFNSSRIPPIIFRLNSRSLWSSFGCSTIRNISEGPTLSIEPFQKVQREVIYFPDIVRKN